MNKEAALQRLTALESEAAELRRIIEAPEKLPRLWRPARQDRVWLLNGDGSPQRLNSAEYSMGYVEHGRAFPSREIAEKAAPLMARANKIISAALQADPGAGEWIIGERSRTASLRDGGSWEENNFFTASACPVFVHTKQQAEEMARILNAEQIK
jgi:hypothetical protein